jgi:hypothetical protein
MDKDIKTSGLRKRLGTNHWVWLAVGVTIGLLAFVLYRAAVAKDTSVHYHANFALYINGKQEKFEGPGYYQEVTACNANDHNDVKSHVHLHDNVSHAIHVHAAGRTWGDFFANLGYALGDTVLSDGRTAYVDGQDGNRLSFMLNGNFETNIANKVINSEDRLLINYGSEAPTEAADSTSQNRTLVDRYNAVAKDAHKFNATKDPGACSGGHEFGLSDRLKDALGLSSSH